MPPTTEVHSDPTLNMSCPDLLNNVLGTASGSWIKVRGYDKTTTHIMIAGVATVQLRGSNEEAPIDSDDGVDLVAAGLTQLAPGTVISASTIVRTNSPLKWIKTKVPTWSSGAVNAMLEAV